MPDEITNGLGNLLGAVPGKGVALGPGPGAVRQGQAGFQGLVRGGAAVGVLGKAVGQDTAGVFQGTAGEHRAGAGVIGQIQHALQGKGPDLNVPLGFAPAVEAVYNLRGHLPAGGCVSVIALAPEIEVPGNGGGDNEQRQGGLVCTPEGGQVYAPLQLRGRDGGRCRGGFAAFKEPDAALSEGLGMVLIALLGHGKVQNAAQQADGHQGHGRKDQALPGAVFPAAGAQQQHQHSSQPEEKGPALRGELGQQATEQQGRNAEKQGQGAAFPPQHTAGNGQKHIAAPQGHGQLYGAHGVIRELQIAQVVNAVQLPADELQQGHKLGSGFRPPEEKARAEADQTQRHRAAPASWKDQQSQQEAQRPDQCRRVPG